MEIKKKFDPSKIPPLGFHCEENKNSCKFKWKFEGLDDYHFEFNITLWFHSFKDLFRRKK